MIKGEGGRVACDVMSCMSCHDTKNGCSHIIRMKDYIPCNVMSFYDFMMSCHVISWNHVPVITCHVISYPCHNMSLWHYMPCHVFTLHTGCWHITRIKGCMSCHFMTTCPVMSCHVMSCHVISCHVMSCHVMSCHAMPCHTMPCHAMPSHYILVAGILPEWRVVCHIMSLYNVSYDNYLTVK